MTVVLRSPDEGYLLNLDGTPSRVSHQWDRWGGPYISWMYSHPEIFRDIIPRQIRQTRLDKQVAEKYEDTNIEVKGLFPHLFEAVMQPLQS